MISFRHVLCLCTAGLLVGGGGCAHDASPPPEGTLQQAFGRLVEYGGEFRSGTLEPIAWLAAGAARVRQEQGVWPATVDAIDGADPHHAEAMRKLSGVVFRELSPESLQIEGEVQEPARARFTAVLTCEETGAGSEPTFSLRMEMQTIGSASPL